MRALAALDRREEADGIMRRLEDEARQYVRAEVLAMGYWALGDADQAFVCLHRAYETRSAGLIYLHLDPPGYLPLRSDPRFAELTQRIGLC